MAVGTHYVQMTVQSAQVPALLTDWQCLLCVCDVPLGINAIAASFVRNLAADLSDLEVTLADQTTPTPWRLAEALLFDQTVGAERLWLWINAPIVAAAPDTVFYVWRGCSAPTGQNSGADVVCADARVYFPCDAVMGSWEDWTGYGNDGVPAGTLEARTGVVGGSSGARVDESNYGYVTVAADASLVFTTALTLSCWVLSAGGSAEFVMHGHITQNERYAYYVYLIGATNTVRWTYDRYQHCEAVVPGVGDGNLHHIAGTLSGADQRLFVDGQQVRAVTSTFGAIDTCMGLRLFRTGTLGGDSPKNLDEVLLLGRAWAPAEVLAYYRMTNDPASWAVSGPETAVAAIVLTRFPLSGGRTPNYQDVAAPPGYVLSGGRSPGYASIRKRRMGG